MSKKWMGIAAAALVVVAGLVVVQVFRTTISPQNISLTHLVVSEKAITLRGDLAASAVDYRAYTVEEQDGKLFVKIKGSSLSLTEPDGSFEIAIANQFEKVNEVYLQGDSAEDTRLVWPER